MMMTFKTYKQLYAQYDAARRTAGFVKMLAQVAGRTFFVTKLSDKSVILNASVGILTLPDSARGYLFHPSWFLNKRNIKINTRKLY